METHPLVTIVTPSYNQAAYLEEAVESVLNQVYNNIQYILIDGGSTDGIAKIIKKYASRLDYWVSEKDRGQTDALNKGFAHTKGKYCAWLNADDRLKPNAVAEAVDYLEKNSDVGMVYGDADFIDVEGNVIGRFAARQTDYAKLRKGYVHIPQQAAFWRASLWWQVGPLDPDVTFAMDYDLWVRLAKVSKLKYVPRLWAEFRLHQDSKTLINDMLAWEDMLKVHKREGGSALSVIVAKYWLRRLLFPLIRINRQRMARMSQA
ncbi:MAG: glycosyltransferase family 2 protein [Anaerolineales bacterium]